MVNDNFVLGEMKYLDIIELNYYYKKNDDNKG